VDPPLPSDGDASREAAAVYHRLTSFGPGRDSTTPPDDPRLRSDLTPNDPARLPPPVKRYRQPLEVAELPRELPAVGVTAGDALAGRLPPAGRALDLAGLGRLLHLSAGVVRVTRRPTPPRTLLYRAAGSAGGRFPLELYVAARGVAGLSDGVWWYDPQAHALRRVGPPAAGGGTTVVVCGVPWRTGWRYAERGYRHVYWDAGTMLSQLLATAAAAGAEPRLWSRFPDARVSALVGADGVHEFPLALVTLGAGAPATEPGGPAERGEVDRDPQELPLVTATQRAGDMEGLGAPWPAGPVAAPPSQATPPLDEVILHRGSARRMDPAAGVARELLDWPLAVALRGIHVPHFVVVHAVRDVAPGVYRVPDLAHPVRDRVPREELVRVCLDQWLGGDAAYVAIGAAELERLGARTYRDAQLAAGLVAGRLHLAAYALGAGASGMTFLDSAVPELLGAPLAGLLFTCVGVPAYRSTPGGGPGRPVAVRVPRPRLEP